jgi:hypothetical protein
MGADFLVAFIAAGRRKRLDVDAGRSALERLHATPLEEWPREFLERECGDVPEDRDEAESMKNSFLECLLTDLHIVEKELSLRAPVGRLVSDGPVRRDLWSGTIGNKLIILSGGMSWGDAPTEAFSALDRLVSAGITRAMGFDW